MNDIRDVKNALTKSRTIVANPRSASKVIMIRCWRHKTYVRAVNITGVDGVRLRSNIPLKWYL
jgi:hypothetical protein